MNKQSLLLIPTLIVTLGVGAQERPTDPLGPVTKCVNNDEFHYEKRDRLPTGSSSRLVNTSAGQARVTTADGYRLMVYRKTSSPLVNLKLERSAEGRFSTDRNAIVAQMKDMAAGTKTPYQVNLETSTLNGMEVLALNNPSIEHSPGIISFYTLLDVRNGTVATAYLLNQPPEIREYSTDAEYAALRDRFIDLLSACMSRSAAVDNLS